MGLRSGEDWAEVTFDLRVLQQTGNESTLHHGKNLGETMFSRFLWLPHFMHTHLAVLSVSLMTSDILYLKKGNSNGECLAASLNYTLGQQYFDNH